VLRAARPRAKPPDRSHSLASAAFTASHGEETAPSRLADLADDVLADELLAAERTAAGAAAGAAEGVIVEV
jgi:hypothetical protein